MNSTTCNSVSVAPWCCGQLSGPRGDAARCPRTDRRWPGCGCRCSCAKEITAGRALQALPARRTVPVSGFRGGRRDRRPRDSAQPSSGMRPRRLLRSVLRRCEKAWATTAANCSPARRTAARRRTVRRATADQTRGGGVKAPGPTSNSFSHLQPGRQHHGQPAVVARARAARHAVDDFLLQHDMHVGDAVRDAAGSGTAAAWRCCRAGCPPGAAAPPQLRRQRVRSNSSASPSCRRSAGPAGAQGGGQVAVDLDRIERVDALEQVGGERARAGTDLHQVLARPRVHRVDDPAQDALIVQEVLAETLARADHARWLPDQLGRQPHRRQQAAVLGACRCRQGPAPCRGPPRCGSAAGPA